MDRDEYFQVDDNSHYYKINLVIELRQLPSYLIDEQDWIVKQRMYD